MTKVTKTTETELKLLLTQDSYKALKNQLEKKGVDLKQINIFFDNPEQVLRKNKWALRLRFQNEKAILTAKGPCRPDNGVFQRKEIESEIPFQTGQKLKNGFSIDGINASPAQYILQKFGKLILSPYLTFKNTRSLVDFDGFCLELDHSEANGNSLYELECETETPKLVQIKEKLHHFFDEFGWDFQFSSKSKLEWALNK